LKLFRKIAIVGVGLIGGSIGIAARKRRLAGEVIGICRRETSRRKALKFKACDRATLDLARGVRDADLIIIAVPVGKIVDRVLECARHMKKGAIITDVGSSKEYLVREICKRTGNRLNFIGSHPMAGSDKTGVLNADGNIFENAPLILTRTKNTKRKALRLLEGFWRILGCRTFILSPKEHDEHISLASYLPHIVSFALSYSQTNSSVKFAGGSLKDTTRVASSDAGIWRDIFLSAGPAAISSIDTFLKNIEKLKKAIAHRDSKEIELFLKKAKEVRKRIL